MPWDYKSGNIPDAMKYFKPSIQKKAIAISNAILANTGDEGKAIAIGISKAKGIHDKKKKSLVKLAFTIPGAVVGGFIGGKIGENISNEKNKYKNKKIGTFTGSIIGAAGGTYAGKKYFEKYIKNNYKMPTRKTDIQKFFKEHGHDYSKIKTKLDAKKIYRSAAMKHHPDMPTGNSEKFKKLSTDWENVENSSWFNKLASIQNSKFFKDLFKAIKKGNDKFLVDKVENIKEKIKEPIL